jgi:tetratricopeptide (TPR) repeat protein
MSRLRIGPLLITCVALTLVMPSCGSGPQWTTDSSQALEEFELGLEASMKLYHADAENHFRKAIELDPEFVAAKLRLLEYHQGEDERAEIITELRQVDPESLTPLEQFLVEYVLARVDREPASADQLLEEFLVDHPEDPFALAICSFEAWKSMDWPKAEKHYRNLLEIDPNWVIAQNRLGYMAMAQGKFDEAEELFKTYKYIAPDQANPHDSLGELLTLLGRYDEAREELEQALAIKSDFCPPYQHLFDLAVLEGRTQDFEEIGRRAVDNCGQEAENYYRCASFLWTAFLEGSYDAPWETAEEECLEQLDESDFLAYQFLNRSGRSSEAQALEERLLRQIQEMEESYPAGVTERRAVLHHAEGLRLAAAGDFSAAAERFRKADEDLIYWGEGLGIMKLYNRLALAWVLEKSGDLEASNRIVEKVRAVNPFFAEAYHGIGHGLTGS